MGIVINSINASQQVYMPLSAIVSVVCERAAYGARRWAGTASPDAGAWEYTAARGTAFSRVLSGAYKCLLTS